MKNEQLEKGSSAKSGLYIKGEGEVRMTVNSVELWGWN